MTHSKTCFIVGGLGFIGTNLCHYLNQRGYEVVLGTKQKFTRDTGFIHIDMNSQWPDYIQSISDKIDVIWLAGNTVPASSGNTTTNEFNQNIFPLTEFLSKALKADKIRKFIFLSSGGSIYGDKNDTEPIIESAPKHPLSLYGLTKILSEQYIDFYIRNSSAEAIILRPGNVYGPNQNLDKPQGIIGHTFKAILNDYPITVYDNGTTVRDYIYVDDLSEALHLVLQRESAYNQVNFYNLGNGIGYSVLNVIKMIEDVTNQEVKKNWEGSRFIDCNYNVLNSEKFIEAYHWHPEVSFQTGLEMVWQWFQNERNKS